MTQPNDDTPHESRNFVSKTIVRRILWGASRDLQPPQDYLQLLRKDEPKMMTLVDILSRSLLGTHGPSSSVTSNTEQDKQFMNAMTIMFALGFKTGGENMREFYSDAFDGLVEPPYDYNDEDFK